jgi:Ca2+-binding RTX toxin-like protein
LDTATNNNLGWIYNSPVSSEKLSASYSSGSLSEGLYFNLKYQTTIDYQSEGRRRERTVRGGSGKDVLIGGKYIDYLQGGDGDDFLFGGKKYDQDKSSEFYGIGNSGSYTFEGANDIMEGGPGKDIFMVNITNLTFLKDFNPAEDQLILYTEEGRSVRGVTDWTPPLLTSQFTIRSMWGGKQFIQYNGLPFAVYIGAAGGVSEQWFTSKGSTVFSADQSWTSFLFSTEKTAEDITMRWLSSGNTSSETRSIEAGYTVTPVVATWSQELQIISVSQAGLQGGIVHANQIDFASSAQQSSILNGSSSDDELWGKAGWDILDGGKGNDLIRAGNGRDIITGGSGNDELHGDFGWNTFKSEKDGFLDLIVIKSDEYVSNWLYGKAGNNPNGEKADIIESLDSNDRIKVIGVFTPDLSFRAGAIAHGVSGIGIYARGALEGLYTGGDLTVSQITAMTTGDGSAAAVANQVRSYGWTGLY